MTSLARIVGIWVFMFSLFALGQGSPVRELTTDTARLEEHTRGMGVSVVLSTRAVRAKAWLGERFIEGQYPNTVRVVNELKISVNKKHLFVPRSTFTDLVDVRKADIAFTKDGGVLRIHGGDASESFEVKIEFDKVGVRRRSLFNSAISGAPLQETTYHLRVMADRP